MIVGIVCDVEVFKLNHETIVWQIIQDYLVGLSLRETRLAAVFIRTSYTISRGSITLLERQENPLFLLLKTACSFN